MLSLNRLLVDSVSMRRIIAGKVRTALSGISARSYISGKDWVEYQGLHIKDGAAELPNSAPLVNSTRKGRSGVIVFHPTSKGRRMSEAVYKRLEKELLFHEANEHLGTLVLVCSANATLQGADYRACFSNKTGSLIKEKLLSLKRVEYATINQAHISDLPIMAIMNGCFMSSAASLALNCRFPIVTESTTVRFPNIYMGCFPDAGASKLLSGLGGLGMYMALTGEPISGIDLIHYGFSHYFIEDEALEWFVNDMSRNESRNLDRIHELYDTLAMPLQKMTLESMDFYNNINHLFNPCFYSDTSVVDLIKRLEADPSDFAKETLTKITEERNAFSMNLTWNVIRDAAKLSIHGTLKRDLHIWSNLLNGDRFDFVYNLQFLQPLTTSLDISEFTDSLQKETERLLVPNPEIHFDLEKINHYDIPMFRGDGLGNESYMKVVSDDEYDWDRVDQDTYHIIPEEDDILPKKRAFKHPVTGITHLVPPEWMDDMRVAKENQRRERERQIAFEGDFAMSHGPKSKYEK